MNERIFTEEIIRAATEPVDGPGGIIWCAPHRQWEHRTDAGDCATTQAAITGEFVAAYALSGPCPTITDVMAALQSGTVEPDVTGGSDDYIDPHELELRRQGNGAYRDAVMEQWLAEIDSRIEPDAQVATFSGPTRTPDPYRRRLDDNTFALYTYSPTGSPLVHMGTMSPRARRGVDSYYQEHTGSTIDSGHGMTIDELLGQIDETLAEHHGEQENG